MYSILWLIAFYRVAWSSVFLAHLDAPTFSSRHATLRPARRYQDLFKRSDEFSLGYQVELAYVDYHPDEPSMSSHIHLEADQPILLLEEYDDLLQGVTCVDTRMDIIFRSHTLYMTARDACRTLVGGLLISSHHTCGDEGAHTVYKVLNLTFDDETLRFIFDLKESIIEKEFHTVTVDFGHTNDRYVIQKHDRLSRRDTATPTRMGVGRPTVSLLPTSVQSIAQQTADTYNRTDLGFTQINTTFFENNSTFDYPNPIRLGCANCSAKGEMITTSGKFRLDLGAWILGEDDDPVKSGFVQVDLNGFEMSIGLKATPPSHLPKIKYDLLNYPAFGFAIPKIGHFGITILLTAFMHVGVNESFEIGFGFDVKVPDSTARLDIAELKNSKITGFNQTKVSLKPFSANASNVELSIVAGLQPGITAGLEFFGFGFSGGPYVSLPTVNMTVSQLGTDKVGANCKEDGETDVKFKDAFKNLTHVDYSLGIAAGLGLHLGFWDTDWDVWSTVLLNETQCLAYQTAGPTTGLAYATAVLASITQKPTPSSSGIGAAKKSGTIRQIPEGYKGIWLAIFGVVSVMIALNV